MIKDKIKKYNQGPLLKIINSPVDLRKLKESQLPQLANELRQYIVDIVFATRYPQDFGMEKFADLIDFGGSPRASINLAKAAKAYAFIKRRGYVIPEDVRAICKDVLRHRIGLSYEAEAENISSEDVITEILNKVEIP